MSKTTVIVGGGIVGLNIALCLSESGKGGEIFLLEREKFLGHHTSTRNSEVAHAGFAYPPGSLKSTLCVEGNPLTFSLCDRLGVAYRREGKWIVAHSDADSKALSAMMDNAKACGVPGMREANPDEVERAVPEMAKPSAAAFSASSGIMDVAGLIRAIEAALSNRDNAHIIYPCGVEGIDVKRGVVSTDRGEMPFDTLINSAGLFSDEIYKMAGGKRAFEIHPCKGEYYTWRKGKVKGLIYPVPHRFFETGDAAKVSSMGVHLHRSVAGELFIGPTEEMLPMSAKTDYSIHITAEEMSQRVAPLLKKRPDPTELEQAFAGNRPKLYEGGKPIGDFMIFREGGVVHLLGIESPGLTAAPAIARHVEGMV